MLLRSVVFLHVSPIRMRINSSVLRAMNGHADHSSPVHSLVIVSRVSDSVRNCEILRNLASACRPGESEWGTSGNVDMDKCLGASKRGGNHVVDFLAPVHNNVGACAGHFVTSWRV